jgi:hypothetical protein
MINRIFIILSIILITSNVHAADKIYTYTSSCSSIIYGASRDVRAVDEFNQFTGSITAGTGTLAVTGWKECTFLITNNCDASIVEYKTGPVYYQYYMQPVNVGVPGLCCPSDQEEVNGVCTPKCVAPETRNPVTDQCQNCPTGRYHPVTGECAPLCDYQNSNQGYRIPGFYGADGCVEPDCGTGETYDPENTRCVPHCAAPEELNTTTGACWLPPCPEGETRDIDDVCTDENGLCPDKTYKDENGLCPENYCSNGSPKDAQGKCPEDYCPDGSLKSGGTCPEPPEECWDGSDKPEGGECPPDVRCGAGYHFDVEEDECVKDEKDCPEGLTEDQYGNCVAPVPDCPAGTVAFNGNCRTPEATPPDSNPCPIGKYRVDGQCVTPDDKSGPGSGSDGSGTSENGTGTTGNGDGQPGDDTGEKGEGEHDGQTGFFGDQPGHVAEGKTWGTEVNELDFSPLINASNKFKNSGFVTGFGELTNLYSKLSATGSAPVFTFPFIGGNMVIDLSNFDTVAAIIKTMLSLVIIVGAIWLIAKQWRAA